MKYQRREYILRWMYKHVKIHVRKLKQEDLLTKTLLIIMTLTKVLNPHGCGKADNPLFKLETKISLWSLKENGGAESNPEFWDICQLKHSRDPTELSWPFHQQSRLRRPTRHSITKMVAEFCLYQPWCSSRKEPPEFSSLFFIGALVITTRSTELLSRMGMMDRRELG